MTQTIEHLPSILDIPLGAEALAVWAHPDDEFLVGGLLEQYRLNGITTHAVIATDGEASDRGDPEALRNLHRRQEAGRALARYGILGENQQYLGLPDGGLAGASHVHTIARAIGTLLVERPIHTVITLGHDGYDNHTDHVAVHVAADLAVTSHNISAGSPVRLLGLTRYDTGIQVAADPSLKLHRLAEHRTQFDIDTSDPAYQPAPDTVEQPGIRLSTISRHYLGRYFHNMHTERYEYYPPANA